jgi:SMP-30/Gluconolactonase/LRE-like region
VGRRPPRRLCLNLVRRLPEHSDGCQTDYEGGRQVQQQPARVYRLDPRSGVLNVVADDFEGPNGLCFSPDERRLYIVETGLHRRPGAAPPLHRTAGQPCPRSPRSARGPRRERAVLAHPVGYSAVRRGPGSAHPCVRRRRERQYRAQQPDVPCGKFLETPTASAAMRTDMSGAAPATACTASIRRAYCSARSGCRRRSRTSPSAGAAAVACSSAPRRRSSPSIRTSAARSVLNRSARSAGASLVDRQHFDLSQCASVCAWSRPVHSLPSLGKGVWSGVGAMPRWVLTADQYRGQRPWSLCNGWR